MYLNWHLWCFKVVVKSVKIEEVTVFLVLSTTVLNYTL